MYICFFSFLFSFLPFFSFFFRRNAPAGGDWGDDSPSAPRRHWPEMSFLEKNKLEKWMDKKVPALLMQRCRTNLCAAKILKKSAYLSGREQQAKESQRWERGGRRIESVARCGGELCRKNKSESKSPSLAIAGSWPADHSPNREWYQKIRKRKARRKDQGRASGMPAARVHG